MGDVMIFDALASFGDSPKWIWPKPLKNDRIHGMSKQKLIAGIGGLFFLSLLIVLYGINGTLGIETAYAQAIDTIRDFEGTLSGLFAFVLTALTWLTWLVFMFLNYFLDPTIIFDLDGSGGGALVKLLNDLWRLSRDLMNVIFAVALIVVAIYVVITAKKDFVVGYLPKFVLAVILVNFSWFACFAVLDLAHVLAATVYQIPGLIVTNPKVCRDGQLQNYQMVRNLQFFLSDEEKAKLTGGFEPDGKTAKPRGNGWDCSMLFICYQITTIDNLSQVAPHNAILQGLVINHARLASLLDISPPDRVNDPFVAVLFFLLRELTVIIIAGALLFPLLAMVVAFFIRIPVLWMTIAFMPFVFLTFIGGEKLEQFMGGGMGPKKIWDIFLKFAFLPALVAIPLAVGFIMINAGAQLQCGQQATGGAAGQLGRINLPLLSQITDPYQLLWLIMTLLILWNGVFMILKNTEFVKGAATWIEQRGKALGKFLVKAPLAAPIIPGPDGKMTSPLKTIKALDPVRLNNILDSHGVLDEEFFRQAAGGRPTFDRNRTREAGNTLKDNPALRGDIKPLIDAIRNNPTEKNLRNLIDTLNNKLPGLGASRETIAQILEEWRVRGDIVPQELGIDPRILEQIRDILRPAGAAGTPGIVPPGRPAPGSPPGPASTPGGPSGPGAVPPGGAGPI